jgi:hypothetical protein
MTFCPIIFGKSISLDTAGSGALLLWTRSIKAWFTISAADVKISRAFSLRTLF